MINIIGYIDDIIYNKKPRTISLLICTKNEKKIFVKCKTSVRSTLKKGSFINIHCYELGRDLIYYEENVNNLQVIKPKDLVPGNMIDFDNTLIYQVLPEGPQTNIINLCEDIKRISDSINLNKTIEYRFFCTIR